MSELSFNLARKLWVVARTRLQWALGGDPEAVFERVSALLSRDAGHRVVQPGEPTFDS